MGTDSNDMGFLMELVALDSETATFAIPQSPESTFSTTVENWKCMGTPSLVEIEVHAKISRSS